MNIGNLFSKLTDLVNIKGPRDNDITGVEYDSRRVSEGCLFIAVKGFNVDGHDFIQEAVAKGARAVIGEKNLDIPGITYIMVKDSRKALSQASSWFYGYPSEKLKIIGVTGTNGKTTTTYLVKAMLDMAGFKTGVIGTIGNVIGEKVLHAERTTPESLELNRLFFKMADEGVEYVIMEVSSHSLKLHRVDGIDFEVGIFTNLTQDHLDFHKTFEDYFNSKKKLFDLSKKAVINADDESGRKILESISIPAASYSIENKADLMAQDVKIFPEGVFYELKVNGEKFSISYHVPGKFSVYNSLAAIGTGLLLGIPMDTLVEALKRVKGIPGRFEPIKMGQDFTVIVDYSHTPDSLENALKTIKSFARGKILTVFGCGGDRDRKKRPIMGEIASRYSDYSIITSDNPRSEHPEAIIDEIEQGMTNKNYERIADRKEAIRRAIMMAQKEDVVLIAGKGHEDYQILKDRTIHFDDREMAERFIREREKSK